MGSPLYYDRDAVNPSMDRVLCRSPGVVYTQRIRLRRLQRVRDVFTGRRARLEVEGMKTWETDGYFTSDSRHVLFLAKKGARLQYVRKTLVELLGDPVPLGRGSGNELLGRLRPLREACWNLRTTRWYNQPHWFGRMIDQLISSENLYYATLRALQLHHRRARTSRTKRRRKIRKWRARVREAKLLGLPPPPRPRGRGPNWKDRKPLSSDLPLDPQEGDSLSVVWDREERRKHQRHAR